MKIINNTLYNKELILRYNKYYLQSYMVKNFIIITLISLAFAIYMAVVEQWLYAGLLLLILFIYYGLTFGMQKLTTNRMLKRSPLVENPIMQTYVFTELLFSVTNTKTYEVRYEEVVKVRRAKGFYLIQTNDRKTYIVDYNGFENSTDLETLDSFFVEKFNLKAK